MHILTPFWREQSFTEWALKWIQAILVFTGCPAYKKEKIILKKNLPEGRATKKRKTIWFNKYHFNEVVRAREQSQGSGNR